MPDAADHGSVVLSAIVPSRRDLLERAVRMLVATHFTEPSQARLFTFLQRYYDRTGGGVATEKALEDLTRNDDSGRAALLLETYRLYVGEEATDEEFSWSIEQLRELAQERATTEAIVDGMEILRNGKTMPDGETARGADDARAYVMSTFAQIERNYSIEAAPEGDVRTERKSIIDDYAERKRMRETGEARGILFGIDPLDSRTGGMQPGEVVLAAGYTNDGKTTLCVQTAWHAAVIQKKNVVFFTTETIRSQVMRKLVSRHSMLPQFGLAPHGLNSFDLKNGTLSAADEAKFAEVVSDFTKTGDYGKVYVCQVPRGSSVTYLEQRLATLQRKFHIELAVMDYLALLRSDRNRQTTREELAAIMKDTKQVATGFDNGRGLPILSPWQVSRAARIDAEKIEMYTSASLSETAEATNTADLIISMLAPTDNTDRRADVNMQILKNRDGPTANGLRVTVDYATSWFQARASFDTARSSTSTFNTNDDPLSLIQ